MSSLDAEWTSPSRVVCAPYSFNALYHLPLFSAPCRDSSTLGCFDSNKYNGWRLWRVKSMEEYDTGCVLNTAFPGPPPGSAYSANLTTSFKSQCSAPTRIRQNNVCSGQSGTHSSFDEIEFELRIHKVSSCVCSSNLKSETLHFLIACTDNEEPGYCATTLILVPGCCRKGDKFVPKAIPKKKCVDPPSTNRCTGGYIPKVVQIGNGIDSNQVCQCNCVYYPNTLIG
jgi:hypothetical protein